MVLDREIEKLLGARGSTRSVPLKKKAKTSAEVFMQYCSKLEPLTQKDCRNVVEDFNSISA
jgi:hypothetical protein